MLSFCFEGVHSLELNEVLYFGDSGYYVVKDFFMGLKKIYLLICQQHYEKTVSAVSCADV